MRFDLNKCNSNIPLHCTDVRSNVREHIARARSPLVRDARPESVTPQSAHDAPRTPKNRVVFHRGRGDELTVFFFLTTFYLSDHVFRNETSAFGAADSSLFPRVIPPADITLIPCKISARLNHGTCSVNVRFLPAQR